MSLEQLTTFYNAVRDRQLAVVKDMLGSGMDADAVHPWIAGRPLHQAAADPLHIALLEMLLGYGAKVDARDAETGGTALHQLLSATAPLELKVQALDLLLANGADINAIGEDQEENRFTAVDIAGSSGVPGQAILAALLERGGRKGPDA